MVDRCRASVKRAVATVEEIVEAQKCTIALAKETAEVQAAFLDGTKQLQKQVADLNGIYGNMLNALA